MKNSARGVILAAVVGTLLSAPLLAQDSLSTARESAAGPWVEIQDVMRVYFGSPKDVALGTQYNPDARRIATFRRLKDRWHVVTPALLEELSPILPPLARSKLIWIHEHSSVHTQQQDYYTIVIADRR
jgi:hypothetical protein